MAHIFFERLEKRRTTQSLIPVNEVPNIQEIEKWVGTSILRQTENSRQAFLLTPSSYYSAYNGYNPYSIYYTPFSSSNVLQINSPYSTDPWSSWTNPQSFWPLPISFGIPSWVSRMFSRNSFVVPSMSPSRATTPSPFPYPSLGTITSPSTVTTTSLPQDTTTGPSFYDLFGPSYPPGTFYGLIKRSNLKV